MAVSDEGSARQAAHELRPGTGRVAPDPATRELAALAPYIPAWLQARAWRDPGGLRPGTGGREHSAVVYVALAGLAILIDQWTGGADGVAAAVGMLNSALALLIMTAEAAGGRVAAIGPDHLVVLFPTEDSSSATPAKPPSMASPGRRLREAAKAARTGAEALRQVGATLPPLAVADSSEPLTIQVGVSAGPLLAGLVGSAEAGMRPVVAGRPVDRARAAARATPPGTIGIDPQLAGMIEGDDLPFQDRPAPIANSAPDWAALSTAAAAAIRDQLRALLPADLIGPTDPTIRNSLTTSCVAFQGIDYDADPLALTRLQDYCRAVQTAIGPFGGRLAAIDTGAEESRLQLVFGFPVHFEETATWALRASLAIRDSCRLAGITTQRIAVASGPALAATLGADTRCEWRVAGPGPARAQSLVATATPNGIVVDGETARQARPPAGEDGADEVTPLPRPPFVMIPCPPAGEHGPTWELLREVPNTPSPPGTLTGSREAEALEPARQQAWAGQDRIVLLAGPAASGKSRILQTLGQRWAADGGKVCAGQSTPAGKYAPYGVWIGLLRSWCGLDPGLPAHVQTERLQARCRALAPTHVESVPWLAALLGVPHPGEGDTASGGLGAELIMALLTAQAQQRPLLLLFDDLQWTDPASLQLIERLAGRIVDLPVLIAGATRLPVSDGLAWLQRAQARRIDLAPPAEPVSPRASGHQDPFPFHTQTILERAAVLGTRAPLSLLRSLVVPAIDDADLARALTDLRRAGLLYLAAGPAEPEFVFVSNRTAEQTYDRIGEEARRALHSQAVMLIERLPTSPTRLDLLAYHYSRSGQADKAAAYLEQAGDRAAALLAYADAVAYYEEAGRRIDESGAGRDLSHRIELWRKLADVQQQMGEYRAAETSLRQALGASPAAEWSDRALLYCSISRVREARGDYPGALAATRLGEAEIAGRPPGLTWARLRLQAGSVLVRHGRYQEALATLEAALPVLTRSGATADLATGHKVLGNLFQFRGDSTRAREHYIQSLTLRRQLGDRFGCAQVLNNLGNVAWGLGDFAPAQDYYSQTLQIMREVGNQSGQATALVNLASVALYRGDLAAALELNRQSLHLAQQIDKREGMALAYNGIGETLEALGRDDEALAAHSRALDLGEEIGDFYVAGRAALGLARTYLTRGDPARSRAYLDHVAAAAAASPELQAGCYVTMGRLAQAEGQLFEAAVAFDQAAIIGADHGYNLLLAHALRLAGDAANQFGNTDVARTQLDQARRLTMAIGARLEQAHVLCALARLATNGEPPANTEARSLLTEAQDLFVACGAQNYADEVRKQLEDINI